jgi:hypothetical protein
MKKQGFDRMESLLIYKPAGIPALIAAMNAGKSNGKGAGPKKIKAVLAKKLEGLFYWCRQRKREELPLDPVAFTPEALKDALERMELQEDEKDHDDPQ